MEVSFCLFHNYKKSNIKNYRFNRSYITSSKTIAWFEAEKNRSFKLIPRNSILIQRVKIRYIKRKNENSSMHSFFLIFSRIRVVTETRDIMYSEGDNGHALNIKIVDLKRREFSCDSTHWPVKIDNCLAVM